MEQKIKDHVPEIKLSYKATPYKKVALDDMDERQKFIRQLFDEGVIQLQEEIILIVLNLDLYPIGFYKLAKGAKTQCLKDHKLILQILCLTNADAFIIAHNHPNDFKYPSKEDIEGVIDLKMKAGILGVDYLDDMIFTVDDYYSFAERQIYWDEIGF